MPLVDVMSICRQTPSAWQRHYRLGGSVDRVRLFVAARVDTEADATLHWRDQESVPLLHAVDPHRFGHAIYEHLAVEQNHRRAVGVPVVTEVLDLTPSTAVDKLKLGLPIPPIPLTLDRRSRGWDSSYRHRG